jgi:putative thioredoxin
MSENIIEVSQKTFVELVIKRSEKLPVVVDFWAPWCSPCKQLTPILERTASYLEDKVILAKINIDENQSIAAQMQIQSIPMVYAFFNGQVVDGFQGNISESEVKEFFEKVSKLNGPNPQISEKLKHLEVAILNSNWDEALQFSNFILDLDQNNVDACYGKIRSLIELQNFNEAKEIISVLPEEILNEKKLQDLIQSVDIVENSFNASKNILDFEESLKKKPKDINAHLNLASALFGVGRIADCYSLLLSAIKIDPEWNNQEARKKLLSFISSHDLNSNEAKMARRQLSSILFK